MEPDEQRGRREGAIMIMSLLTLGPVGPLRHMGVVVARHSTQPLAPFSGTTIPSICCSDGWQEAEERGQACRDHSSAWRQRRDRADGCTLLRSAEPIDVGVGACGSRRQPRSVAGLATGLLGEFWFSAGVRGLVCFFLDG